MRGKPSVRSWRPPRRAGRLSAQGGQVAILFAIAAVVLISVAGLSLDAGLGYMNRTTLQGAADTASQTGARMLSADYQAGSDTNPFTLADISTAVQGVVTGSSAGPTVGNSYSAFLVTGTDVTFPTGGSPCIASQPASVASPGTAQCIVCQFFPSTSPPTGVPLCDPAELAVLGAPGPLLVDGVEVVPTNTNGTPFLGLLGIHQGSEAANATSIFGLGLDIPPYTVWYDCFSTSSSLTPWIASSGSPTIGDYVMYYNNKGGTKGYQQSAACGDVNDTNASFSGDLHSVLPVPPVVPGWINANSGVDAGSLVSEQAGSEFLIPFVDCIGPANKYPFASCTSDPTFPTACATSTPPGTNQWDLCIVGYAWVRAVNDCNYGSSGTSTACIAQIVQNPNLEAGGFLCDPVGSPNPPCENAANTSGAQSLVVELYTT